jgi:hypothetical protein
VARLHQMSERLSRRGTFLVLYALFAIAVGVLNIGVFAVTGFTAIQLLWMDSPSVWEALKTLVLLPVLAIQDSLVAFLAGCVLAPLILVALAVIRGRRLRMPYLVAFPTIGVVLAMIGPRPFFVWGSVTAVAAPSVIAWVLDGWCLYLGAQPDPTDEVA